MRILPEDPNYPVRLCDLDLPPPITVSGSLATQRRIVAIVGARKADRGAVAFAHALAYHLARADVIVVSGGALGVDTAAHEGALRGGGATWCVACTGKNHVYPPHNAALFDALARSDRSRMIWPFADPIEVSKYTPRQRNGILVGLAECVVIIQAKYNSGSRNAATWAGQLNRPAYVVPGMPWDPRYAGSVEIAANGGHTLWSIVAFFKKLGLPIPNLDDPAAEYCGLMPPKPRLKPLRQQKQTYSDGPLFAVDRRSWTAAENLVFSKLSIAPTQLEEVVERTGLGASSAVTALLTLSLKDVVVEGPDGFFRRRREL